VNVSVKNPRTQKCSYHHVSLCSLFRDIHSLLDVTKDRAFPYVVSVIIGIVVTVVIIIALIFVSVVVLLLLLLFLLLLVSQLMLFCN
jgi:hypothetical protein